MSPPPLAGRKDSIALTIEDGAHHLDLMFSHKDDPPSVTKARDVERQFMERWVAEWREARAVDVKHPEHPQQQQRASEGSGGLTRGGVGTMAHNDAKATVGSNVEASSSEEATTTTPRIRVSWPAGVTGRLFLVISYDLTTEPRLSVGSSFTNAGQIFSVAVDATMSEFAFSAADADAELDAEVDDMGEGKGQTGVFSATEMGSGKAEKDGKAATEELKRTQTRAQAAFPFASLSELPAGAVSLQAVLTPYARYARAEGPPVWLPTFGAFTYSEDYDSYGWANVTTPFGGAKGLSAEGALYSKPTLGKLPLQATPVGDLALTLTETVPAFPAPPPETAMQKFVSIVSPCLSEFWGQPVNVSAWVTLPAGFDDHPTARYPLILNHGHYSYQRLRGWSDAPPVGPVVPPKPKTGNPDDCHYCSSGGGCCDGCEFHAMWQKSAAQYDLQPWSLSAPVTPCFARSGPEPPCPLLIASRGSRHLLPRRFHDSFQQMYAHYFTRNWTDLSLGNLSAFHRARVLLVRVQSANPFFDDSHARTSRDRVLVAPRLPTKLPLKAWGSITRTSHRAAVVWEPGRPGCQTHQMHLIIIQVRRQLRQPRALRRRDHV